MMKKITRLCLLLSILFFTNNKANAQLEDVVTFMRGGPKDAKKLFNSYLTPYSNAVCGSLNNGWYTTALPLKQLGFEFGISMNTGFIPSDDRTFDIEGLNLQNLELSPEKKEELPASTSMKDGVMLQTKEKFPNGDPVMKFRSPDGAKLPMVAFPMLQGNVGLYYGTDFSFRFMPRIRFRGTRTGLWGIALKHDLIQWLPMDTETSTFRLAIQTGFTRVKTTSELDFSPNELSGIDFSKVNEYSYKDQRLDMKMSGFTANLVASAGFEVVGIYGSLGFLKSKAKLEVMGDFPTDFEGYQEIDENKVGIKKKGVHNNPIEIDFKSDIAGKFVPKVTAGIKMNVKVFSLFAEYTHAKYSFLSFGAGINFQ